MWIEWQIYDTCVGNIPHITATARAQPLNVWRLQAVSDIMRRIGNNLLVLDVGCGDGTIGDLISRMGNYVTSIELPKAAVFAHRRGVSSVLASDAEHLPFSSRSFDVVLASEVVEHLWDPNNFFDEAYRVLEADGYLILSTPEGRGGLFYDSHKHYFTVEGLKQMLEARFAMCKVKRLKPIDAPVPTIIVLLRRLIGRKISKSANACS